MVRHSCGRARSSQDGSSRVWLVAARCEGGVAMLAKLLAAGATLAAAGNELWQLWHAAEEDRLSRCQDASNPLAPTFQDDHWTSTVANNAEQTCMRVPWGPAKTVARLEPSPLRQQQTGCSCSPLASASQMAHWVLACKTGIIGRVQCV